jgi:hypothetical protein
MTKPTRSPAHKQTNPPPLTVSLLVEEKNETVIFSRVDSAMELAGHVLADDKINPGRRQ